MKSVYKFEEDCEVQNFKYMSLYGLSVDENCLCLEIV